MRDCSGVACNIMWPFTRVGGGGVSDTENEMKLEVEDMSLLMQ